jgi:prepilin peptidase CpaA
MEANMIAQSVTIASGLVFGAALLDGAISDLRRFRIPNRVPLWLLAAFVPMAAVAAQEQGQGQGQEWIGHLCVGLALFALGTLLFALKVWGGGDAKMLAAAGLVVGPSGLARFLLVMALTGGVLATIALLARRVPLGPPGPLRRWGERLAASGAVPYGVAIAAGGLDWWGWSVLAA